MHYYISTLITDLGTGRHVLTWLCIFRIKSNAK
jgi:hypothetical protein